MLSRFLRAWLPVAVMCVVIFLLSQDANSGRHSDTVLGWILSLVGANTPHLRHLLDEPFRKFAHVFVYFVLGAFSYRGFALGSRHFSPGAAVRALIFSAAYAATDEIHQSFIPSRGPDVRDVLLDTSAVLLALLIIWLWQRPRAGRPLLTPASSGG